MLSEGARGLSEPVTISIGADGKPKVAVGERRGGPMPPPISPIPPIPIPTGGGSGLSMSIHWPPMRLEKVKYLGVNVVEVPPVVGAHLPVPSGMGLVVMESVKDSPAQKAGLQKDDILLKFEGQSLANQDQLRKLTRAKKTGDRERLTCLHEGKEVVREVVLGEREEDVANPGHGPWEPIGWTKHLGTTVSQQVREALQAGVQGKSGGHRSVQIVDGSGAVVTRIGPPEDGLGDNRRFRESAGDAQRREQGGGEPGRPLRPPGDMLERMERELRQLREEVDRLRGLREEMERMRPGRPPG